jgi:hypothetical protein
MRSQAQRPRQSIYETITAKILAAIEATYLDGFQATTVHRSAA